MDVILLDMNFSLGVNSGQEGIIWLSAIHRRYPAIPIVLMTAYPDAKLAVTSLKLGAADFITKPWDNDELLRAVKEAMENAHDVVSLAQLDEAHVKKAAGKCKRNMSKAAEQLGITRQTLYTKYHPD